ncbi:unnamed protein product [Camellia sinensis]
MFSLGHDHHLPQKSFQIKQDDKFFSRLLSKETSSSKAEASCRVLYYGGACGSVPFMWESQPGTPKNPLSDTSLPPLIPPPSYKFSPKPKTKSMQKPSKPSFLFTIFSRKSIASKKDHVSPPSLSSSSISSSYSSGSFSSPSIPMMNHRRSTVHFGADDGDDDQNGSPTSILCCGVRNGFSKEFRGSRSKVNIKYPL